MSRLLIIASTLLSLAMANPVKRDDISCPSQNGTLVISNGKYFIVECGTDHAGGDLPNQPVYVNSLAACVANCAQNSACVDFTLAGSACYQKGSVGPTLSSGFNGARLVNSDDGLVYVTSGTVS